MLLSHKFEAHWSNVLVNCAVLYYATRFCLFVLCIHICNLHSLCTVFLISFALYWCLLILYIIAGLYFHVVLKPNINNEQGVFK